MGPNALKDSLWLVADIPQSIQPQNSWKWMDQLLQDWPHKTPSQKPCPEPTPVPGSLTLKGSKHSFELWPWRRKDLNLSGPARWHQTFDPSSTIGKLPLVFTFYFLWINILNPNQCYILVYIRSGIPYPTYTPTKSLVTPGTMPTQCLCNQGELSRDTRCL